MTEGHTEWFQHTNSPSSSDGSNAVRRLTNKEARENCERDRTGCLAVDFSIEGGTSDVNLVKEPTRYKVTSPEAQCIAKKLSTESSEIEPDKVYVKRCGWRGQTILDDGSSMKSILGGKADDKTLSKQLCQKNGLPRNATREEYATKSRHGTITDLMYGQSNKSLDAHPELHPRAIRPEALETFNKNKGCMSECLQVS